MPTLGTGPPATLTGLAQRELCTLRVIAIELSSNTPLLSKAHTDHYQLSFC